MHSYFVRGSVVFFFTITVLFLVALGCGFTSTFLGLDPSVHATPDVKVLQLRGLRGRLGYQSPVMTWDQADLRLSVDADFAPVFHWNVKQLFVYITADYATPEHPRNRVVLWDRVVNRPDLYRVVLEDEKPEYDLVDMDRSLANSHVNITLHWDVMPNVGFLSSGSFAGQQPVAMPAQYSQ
eukprot:TRINITY_DN96962_c0_g1_i1.p1 TRINITY_DN96962_c0_g1~~TRINITY_DN96962_c0_g1_i1.p1  ORF type:complete len:181 (+),score=74.79 TRINITY_DN96962_c0_g1_i1:1-543(+)